MKHPLLTTIAAVLFRFLFPALLALLFGTGPAWATDFYVYYLGGQSNMDGYGVVKDLPDPLAGPQEEVLIFHGNPSADGKAVDGRGLWTPLRPGHGVGFQSDGKGNRYSDRFGVELSFARAMQQQYPDRRIAIIKYSRGGTSIDEKAAGGFGCWEPDFAKGNGVNQYDHFLATVRHAWADTDIDGDGTPDRLIPAGILWMQGESDAHYTPEIAHKYQANLRRLMDLVRASFRSDDLPVVIGRISYSKREPPSWKHGEIVRQAQADYVAADGNASLVTSTDDYGYSDPWHYDSGGYIDLGRQFAKEMIELEKVPTGQQYTMGGGSLIWTSPSQDSRGSMPIGNGELGANVWVEENGDLLFYLSRTDAWSENCRLLKLGKVRVTLMPNPFQKGGRFSQTLDVERGEILIRFKTAEQDAAIRFAVDALHPVVTVDIDSKQPVEACVSLEPWRTQRRELKGAEAHSAYGLLPAGDESVEVTPIIVEPDRIMAGQKNSVIWYHRNERSIWKANLQLQALDHVAENQVDPLLNRTFGALIQGEGLVNQSDSVLKSAAPANRIHVAIYTLTAQTTTAAAWLTQLDAEAMRICALSRDQRLTAHRAWWKGFWERSHIRISTENDKDKALVENINRGYRLQRFVNACGGRGNFPIKFNGSIFTVDTMNHTDRFKGHDADYRQWGGPYWWQNTRLPYWSMLLSGDFDLMSPLFEMFRNNLESRKVATRKYYDHDGAFFPETQYFWGTYADGNYGRDRTELPNGMTVNRFIRYYWQGGLELSLMMLDHYAFTGDDAFAGQTLVPLASAILTFFDQHWQRDANGKIRFDPAMALETYREAVNPLVEIVGIQKVCDEMLALPDRLTTAAQRTQWKRLISELPPVPMREVDGETVLACADSYSGKQNIENPELYAIFPYRRYGLGKPDLELARRTFAKRLIKRTGGWQQNAIKAAYLGLADEAVKMVGQNFSSKSSQHRFGAMWGPNYDWIPDQCHGSVAMTALQRMLLQYEGDRIRLLPAWPKHWDVEFKLHAPRKTTVEGSVRNGDIMDLKVSPAFRRKDVVRG